MQLLAIILPSVGGTGGVGEAAQAEAEGGGGVQAPFSGAGRSKNG